MRDVVGICYVKLCLFVCHCVWSLSGFVCDAITTSGHVCSKGPAKSRTHPLGVFVYLLGSMFGYCATGGGYHGGGVFGPLGTMVPWGDSPREGRAAHGPLHPAVWIPLGSCCGLCRVVVLALQFLVCSLCSRCYFSGVGVCFRSFEPFTTRPVFVL